MTTIEEHFEITYNAIKNIKEDKVGLALLSLCSLKELVKTTNAEREARIAELETALQPFADRADEFCLIQDGNKTLVSIHHIHEAKKVLQQKANQ